MVVQGIADTSYTGQGDHTELTHSDEDEDQHSTQDRAANQGLDVGSGIHCSVLSFYVSN